MARPEFVPVFEEPESTIKARMLGRISDEWRKEPGDFIYDAIAASPMEVQLGEIRQDFILKNAFPQYAEDVFLDNCLAAVGLTRGQATQNKRKIQVNAAAGVAISKGAVALSLVTDEGGNPYEFFVDTEVVFVAAGIQNVTLISRSYGIATNLATGTEFIFTPSVPGIKSITDLGTVIPAVDTESDEAAYARYEFKMQNPDTGGNKNDYVRWAEHNEDGTKRAAVGKAKCLPRWDGNGTVKIVLLGSDYKPATAEVVQVVQTYIDPGSTGLGEGKAPCGAAVTVTAAEPLEINIAATVQLYAGVISETALNDFKLSVKSYLDSIAFVPAEEGADHNNLPVIIAKIGSLLIGTNGVANYSDLTVNGGIVDITVSTYQVAVQGTVVFNQ